MGRAAKQLTSFRKVYMGGEEVEFDHIKRGDKYQIYLEGGVFQLCTADGDAFPIGNNGNAGVKCSIFAFGSDDELKEAYL